MTGRLPGVDLARFVALAGMMVAHIFLTGSSPAQDLALDLVAGRAAALFAVLAGVSLGLATARTPPSARERAGARVGIAVRGVLIALLGFALVSLETRVAVILPYYGLAFVLILPALFWRLRVLLPAAVGWLVAGPFLSFLLRSDLPFGVSEQPRFGALGDPADLLRLLFLTGYYPVLVWLGYLLLGLALSRVALHKRRTALWLVLIGVATAAAARLASGVLLGNLGLAERLVAPPEAYFLLGSPDVTVEEFYGTVPTTTPAWLALVAPHSGTPLDLLHTSGVAVAVLGACLLLPHIGQTVLLPLRALGSMPLSAYAGHLLALHFFPGSGWGTLLGQLLVLGLLATAWRSAMGRGPLESVVGEAARWSGRAVTARGTRAS